MLSTGIPSSFASESRIENGAWVAAEITSSPSGCSHAVRGLGLEVALVHPRRPEGAPHDRIAGRERGLDVAVLELRRAEHVLGQVLVLAEAVGRDGCVGVADVGSLTDGGRFDPRSGRARSGGGFEVEDGLERIELDLDKLDGVLRDRLALGDHDRQRLAGVDDLLARRAARRAARGRRL